MSRFALKQGKDLSHLCRLPDEILEEIVSELDEHRDLVAFALTSRICAATVVPNHTQYRILRVRHTLPEMWAHLARRADLARNVREVHICERTNFLAADHHPTSLIDNELDGAADNAEESVRIRNICKALSHMCRLHTFTWSWKNVQGQQRPVSHPAHENSILAALSNLPRLEHVSFKGMFAMHALSSHIDAMGITYPGWKLSNLLSLSLEGISWAKVGNSKHIQRLLAQSPNLECLHVPMEFPHLAECHLPKLKQLKLVLQNAAISLALDRSRTLFLENHPTIEVLHWLPLGMPQLSAGALPNLKSLRSNRQFIMALNDPSFGSSQAAASLFTPPSTPLANTIPVPVDVEPTAVLPMIRRNIENLDVYALDAHTLLELKCIQPNNLRRLKLSNFDSLDTLHEIADTFPNIEWLLLPSMYMPPDSLLPILVTKAMWLEILPMFPKLEIFRGLGLWHSVSHDKDELHQVILALVQTCPNLRVLDRADKHRNWDPLKEIVITRTGEFQEHISYGIVRKRNRNPFDVTEGLFD